MKSFFQWKAHIEILPNAAMVRFLCECGEPAGMHATRIYYRRRDKLTIPDLACGMVLPLGSERYVLADKEPEPLRTVEALALQSPDRSGWTAFCGKYDYEEEEFCIFK
ncbi:MAG: hypothetical protein IIY70_02145 [Oscillospiraceae bacterium]|nr:hypothetical protein [Oscillospiraceae bacterium]